MESHPLLFYSYRIAYSSVWHWASELRTHDDAPGLDKDGPMSHQLHCVRSSDAQCHTDESTRNAEKYGFDEELIEDVHAASSNTHSQTYLACSLRDADIHDVHDADASHNERDTCHTTQRTISSLTDPIR